MIYTKLNIRLFKKLISGFVNYLSDFIKPAHNRLGISSSTWRAVFTIAQLRGIKVFLWRRKFYRSSHNITFIWPESIRPAKTTAFKSFYQ